MIYILSDYFNVLYDRIWIVTPTAITMNIRRRSQCSATKMAQKSRVSHKVLIETTLTLFGIALCSRKLEIYGPNFGWFISQSYRFLLLLKNKVAARSRNGVVGSTGTKAPAIPNPKAIKPNIVKTIFTSILNFGQRRYCFYMKIAKFVRLTSAKP